MKSVNENNGQGIIISHDGLKWCKFTLVLYDDENVKKVNLERHQKNFQKSLAKFNVEPDRWQDFVRKFNSSGSSFMKMKDGTLLYFYDYAKNCFMAKITPWLEETNKP